jgi:hypothetical protein
MLQVVLLKGEGTRHKQRKVGDDAGENIGQPSPEDETVGAFMDHDEQPMAGERPNAVGQGKYEPDRPVCHKPRNGELQAYQSQDAPEGGRTWSNEGPDLRMATEYLFGTVAVRLGAGGI